MYLRPKSMFILVITLAEFFYFVNGAIFFGGNSEKMSNYYFNLTRSDSFLSEMKSCPPSLKGYKCLQQSMRNFGENARIWKAPIADKPDCEYDVELKNVIQTSEEIVFVFTIQQSHCKICLNILGGSTFEIHAYNDIAVVSCFAFDNLSNTYLVHCRFPTISYDSNSSYADSGRISNLCVSLTIVLSHEHFDAYSEVLIQYDHKPSNHLNTLLHPISDNMTFCTQSNTLDKLDSEKANFSLSDLILPDGVVWYSGKWFTEESLASLKKKKLISTIRNSNIGCNDDSICYTSLMEYEGRRGIVNSAYDYKVHHNKATNYTTVKSSYNITSIAEASPEILADKYSFVPTMSHIAANGRDRLKTEYIESESYDADKVQINSNNWTYVFVGASHMRYNFHAITAYLLGPDSIKGLGPKHLDVTIGKYSFDESLFAEVIADTLGLYCDSPADPKHRRMFFLQSGHWDLSHYSLRYMTQMDDAAHGGMKLIRILERIFSGNISCPSINHLVWMTPVPYPLCFSDRYHWKSCESDRAGRLNSNFEALSKNYLESLLAAYNSNPSAMERIQFSIIDAYNIITPRLLFNEDNEVEKNHYLMRVSPFKIERSTRNSNNSRTHRHHNHSHTEQSIIATPGGSAVMQSMLLAMKWADRHVNNIMH